MNYVIGTYINVNPEHFLELLAGHPHLIGNSKILMNLGLDFVDDFGAQHAEGYCQVAGDAARLSG